MLSVLLSNAVIAGHDRAPEAGGGAGGRDHQVGAAENQGRPGPKLRGIQRLMLKATWHLHLSHIELLLLVKGGLSWKIYILH